jgi:hypothetical protein
MTPQVVQGGFATGDYDVDHAQQARRFTDGESPAGGRHLPGWTTTRHRMAAEPLA